MQRVQTSGVGPPSTLDGEFTCGAAIPLRRIRSEPMTSTRLLIPVLIASALGAQTDRPKVLGVAHIAVYVKDLDKTLQFYKGMLGYDVPFTLPKKGGTGIRIAFVKVNDNQYFEIFNEADRGEGQLNHISFYTDSAGRMYAYLKLKGVEVMGD